MCKIQPVDNACSTASAAPLWGPHPSAKRQCVSGGGPSITACGQGVRSHLLAVPCSVWGRQGGTESKSTKSDFSWFFWEIWNNVPWCTWIISKTQLILLGLALGCLARQTWLQLPRGTSIHQPPPLENYKTSGECLVLMQNLRPCLIMFAWSASGASAQIIHRKDSKSRPIGTQYVHSKLCVFQSPAHCLLSSKTSNASQNQVWHQCSCRTGAGSSTSNSIPKV